MLRVGDHRELQAAVLALKAMNRDLAGDIRRATTATMGPEWKQAVAGEVRTGQDLRILARGARVAGGNPPAAVAASSRRALSGGLVPVQVWGSWEFGTTNQNRPTTYRRRNRVHGGTHTVTRRTRRQVPRRAGKGRVLHAAFAGIGPRVASLWVQLIVRKTHDAIERGS